MQKLTEEQGIVLTGFTGFLCCESFSLFHTDVEKRLNRVVFTHEFTSKEFAESLKELYRADFEKLI
jgi:hypothetical protein